MEFKDRLRELRIKNNMTLEEVAEHVGLQKAAIYKYEHGIVVNPKRGLIEKLASLFDVKPSYLLGMEETPIVKAVKIPVLGTVVAGIPLDAVENIIGWEEISPAMAATGEHFALRIKGTSMEPRICEGDIVVVRKQEDIESGDTAIVLINGGEATVKKVKKTEEGIMLIANNMAVYSPHFYSNKEIEELPVRIIGKVVELRGKL
ncbi:LexA family protein [Acidaminococcus sp. LBK-2]|uniref:LexA family protein n=1 Tax=Acidaminococcus sp. LBK-2 TaxID=3456956 RepID=UPI003FA44F5C